MGKVQQHYVSEIDQFLQKLRKEVPESEAQRAEREQYRRLNELRDNPQREENTHHIWEGF